MFQPWKSDNGAVLPWEYLPAEAGTYHVGQALNLDATTGHLEAVAADLVGAGIGDRVLVTTGSGARAGNPALPCDAAVVAILDAGI